MGSLHEECGVFGIFRQAHADVAHDIYYGLTALQHRGQEAAGIAVCDTMGERGNICLHKNMGLVSEVFNEETLAGMKGNVGIGHVRYSTSGGSVTENVQPLSYHYLKGTLAIVHNGNIVNAGQLKEEMMKEGEVFRATSDTEVIAMRIARMRAHASCIEEAVKEVTKELLGGYALLVMSPRKLVAIRDPLGLKPLCIGKIPDGYVLASESCALSAVDAEFVRDVKPGEIITIRNGKLFSDETLCNNTLCNGSQAHCVFEYIYFARLDSVLDGISVYSARFQAGRMLAKSGPAEADLVTGVPESGLTAAAGFADASGIPFMHAFHKNSYVGRTFIKPTQQERQTGVHMKLNVITEVVKGKRIVLIDDSIVRGTTIANLITMLRKAGAQAVHVRISSPPFLYPCYYGTDVPDSTQLIAKRFSIEEIRKKIGADSLAYLRIEDLKKTTPDLPVCSACFDGKYPTETYDAK